MKCKVYVRITGITWSHNFEGGAYYKDDKNRDWYQLRNKLPEGRTTIVVNTETKKVLTFWKGDPTMVGLHVPNICKVVDVYQIETDLSEDEFLKKDYTFDNDVLTSFERELTYEQNADIRKGILSEYTAIIGVYQDKVEFGTASKKEVEYLRHLKLYRMSVYDVDPEKPFWPEQPVK